MFKLIFRVKFVEAEAELFSHEPSYRWKQIVSVVFFEMLSDFISSLYQFFIVFRLEVFLYFTIDFPIKAVLVGVLFGKIFPVGMPYFTSDLY